MPEESPHFASYLSLKHLTSFLFESETIISEEDAYF